MGFNRKKVRMPEEALLDSQTIIIIGRAGVLGIVSLAITVDIPRTLDN